MSGTVKIKGSDGSQLTINRSDFVPGKHKLWAGEALPATSEQGGEPKKVEESKAETAPTKSERTYSKRG